MTTTGELRFDGRVAIVTGAGGQEPNLGVGYARLLASRGAKVVVNDFGVGPDGSGGLPASAEAVARSIRDAGGQAVADLHSVADAASARAVVQTALDAFGRVDILVNNAGVVMFALFEEISEGDIQRILNTHVMGGVWMAKAAWPHMKAAGYGRIVNITSRSAFGTPMLPVYGAAKAAYIGLTDALSLEGARCGIRINALAPEARTRKHTYMMGLDRDAPMPSMGTIDQVAPVVAYLCHEQCQANGATFFAGNGKVQEFMHYETEGYDNPSLTLEDIAANIDRIRDRAGAHEHKNVTGPELFDTIQRAVYAPKD